MLPETKLEMYTRAVQKPGFLRAAFEWFGSQWRDAAFFNASIRPEPLAMPSLVLGGEASLGPVVQQAFQGVVSNATYDVVPKAGHCKFHPFLSMAFR